MKNPEKNTESLAQTVKRTIITTTIVALILTLSGIFPSHEKSKAAIFGVVWLAAFCIVFGGHWLELLFINEIKFKLPKNMLLIYFVRLGYWFICSIPLYILANWVVSFFSNKTKPWWTFGFVYIGIQLLIHAIMHMRLKKSFYNGVY